MTRIRIRTKIKTKIAKVNGLTTKLAKDIKGQVRKGLQIGKDHRVPRGLQIGKDHSREIMEMIAATMILLASI